MHAIYAVRHGLWSRPAHMQADTSCHVIRHVACRLIRSLTRTASDQSEWCVSCPLTHECAVHTTSLIGTVSQALKATSLSASAAMDCCAYGW